MSSFQLALYVCIALKQQAFAINTHLVELRQALINSHTYLNASDADPLSGRLLVQEMLSVSASRSRSPALRQSRVVLNKEGAANDGATDATKGHGSLAQPVFQTAAHPAGQSVMEIDSLIHGHGHASLPGVAGDDTFMDMLTCAIGFGALLCMAGLYWCLSTKVAGKEPVEEAAEAKRAEGNKEAARNGGEGSDDYIAMGSTSQGRQPKALGYRTEIDGLRAFAVIPVICCHFHLGFPGGFAGVDVFYVISGFLITRILLSDRPMWEFWCSRMRRLFPALAFLLVVVLLAGQFVLQDDMFRSLCEQVRAVLFGLANVHYYEATNYFFNNLQAPMLHCWSLAVEEQFYLLYPFLLWWLSKQHSSPRAIFGTLTLIFLTSLGASIALLHLGNTSFAFYMLPSRAWQFALGGMAVLDQHLTVFDGRGAAEICSLCGLGMIVASYMCFSSATPFPGIAALLPSCGTVLFIASQRTHRTYCGQVLSLQLPAHIGKMSYALYLWHWPTYWFLVHTTDNLELNRNLTILCVAITICAAVLSTVCVEPFFRLASNVPVKAFLSVSACTWFALVMFTMVAWRTHGVQIKASAVYTFKTSDVCDGSNLVDFLKPTASGGKCLEYLSDSQLGALYSVNASDIHAVNIESSKQWTQGKYDGVVNLGPPLKDGEHPSIAVIGSSHCMMYGSTFERLANEYEKKVGYMCANGQTGAFGKPGALTSWDETRLSTLQKWQPEIVLWFEWWTSGYDFNYDVKLLLARAQKVIIFGDVPSIPFPPLEPSDGLTKQAVLKRGQKEGSFAFMNNLGENDDYAKKGFGKWRHDNEATIRQVASNASYQGRVKFFPVESYFVNSATKQLMLIDRCSGSLVYKDFGHLNVDGARRVEPLFRKEVFGQAVCETKP